MAGTRFVVAGGILFAVLRLRGAPAPSAREWWAAARVGLLLVGANALVAGAELSVSSSLAAIVIASVPLWAALAAGFLGDWPRPLDWLGIAVGIGGVVLLQSGGELRSAPASAALLVLSTWCWAAGSMWSRRLPLPKGLMASAAEQLTGGAVLLVVALARGERLAGMPGARPLLAWLYLVAFGSLLAFSAYVFLLELRPARARDELRVREPRRRRRPRRAGGRDRSAPRLRRARARRRGGGARRGPRGAGSRAGAARLSRAVPCHTR